MCSDIEVRNQYLSWEQLGNDCKSEETWATESLRSTPSSRHKARLTPTSSPSPMNDMDGSNMDTSPSLPAMPVGAVMETPNIVTASSVPNPYPGLINNPPAVYPASCYPVYDPYDDPRFSNQPSVGSLGLYNPDSPCSLAAPYPLTGAPAPTLGNSVCSLYEENRPWSQGSGSSTTSEDPRYDCPGVIHQNPSFLNNSVANSSLQHHQQAEYLQHQHHQQHHNHPQHNNNVLSNHVGSNYSSMYNIEYYSCDKYYEKQVQDGSKAVCHEKPHNELYNNGKDLHVHPQMHVQGQHLNHMALQGYPSSDMSESLSTSSESSPKHNVKQPHSEMITTQSIHPNSEPINPSTNTSDSASEALGNRKDSKILELGTLRSSNSTSNGNYPTHYDNQTACLVFDFNRSHPTARISNASEPAPLCNPQSNVMMDHINGTETYHNKAASYDSRTSNNSSPVSSMVNRLSADLVGSNPHSSDLADENQRPSESMPAPRQMSNPSDDRRQHSNTSSTNHISSHLPTPSISDARQCTADLSGGNRHPGDVTSAPQSTDSSKLSCLPNNTVTKSHNIETPRTSCVVQSNNQSCSDASLSTSAERNTQLMSGESNAPTSNSMISAITSTVLTGMTVGASGTADKTPLQPGYTSVIVDAQHYHMAQNDFVR